MAGTPSLSPDELLAHADWLRRLARRLVAGAAADDAVQETWEAALRHPPASDAPLRPWLGRVLLNFVRKGRRADRRRDAREERWGGELDPALPGAEELLARHRAQRVVAELVTELDEPYRSTVLLCYFEGLAPIEVARREGILPGTVRWRLKRGLDLLRTRLDQRHGGDRRAWCALLAPLARSAPPIPALLGTAVIAKGALLMKKKASVVALVVLLLGMGGSLWWLTGSDAGRDRAAALVRRGGAGPAAILAASPEEQAVPATASVEGVVRRRDGRPVDGAVVVLGRATRVAAGRSDSGKPPVAVTAGGGRFAFPSVVPGTYAVTASAPDAAPAVHTPLVLRERAVASVELVLGDPQLVLRGTITEAGGGAIAGAEVWAVWDPQIAVPDQPPEIFQTRSDPHGAYRLALRPGRYRLAAEADGYAAVRETLFITRTHVRDLRLAPAARILGRVLDEAGAPVADAEIWLAPDQTTDVTARDVKSGADGSFAFLDVEAGRYQVTARKGNQVGIGRPVALAVAGLAEGVDVVLGTGSAVLGRVTGEGGRPVAGALVRVYKRTPPFDRRSVARTDADGRYRVEGLHGGPHLVSAEAEGHAISWDEIEVISETRLDLAMVPGARVSGRVVRADGAPADGARISARVILRGGTSGGVRMQRSTIADAEGRFTLDALPAGQISVWAERGADGAAELGPEELAVGGSRDVTLKLAPGSFVSGRVRFDDGRPAAGVQVTARHRSPGASLPPSDTTNEEGRYRLGPLVAGQVVVVAVRKGEPEPRDASDHPDQKNVSLGVAEVRDGVDLVVEAGGAAIAGVALDPSGSPVSGATVLAVREGDDRDGRPGAAERAITAHDGTFRVDDLARGPHRVRATHPDHPDVETTAVAGGAPVTVRFVAGGSVSGTAVDEAGAPVGDHVVTLTPALPAAPTVSRSARQAAERQQGAALRQRVAHGEFSFRNARPGAYDLRVTTHDGRVGHASVTLQAGHQHPPVRLVVGAGVRLTGRVVEYESGAPIPGVSVSAQASGGAIKRPAVTDADGRFTLEKVVPARNVTIRLEGNPRQHVGDHRFVDIDPGRKDLDLGTVKLVRGDFEAKYSALERAGRGSLGVGYQNINGRPVVTSVESFMPGGKAGVQEGDLVLAIDGKPMHELGYQGIFFHVIRPADAPIALTVQTPGHAPRTVTTKMILRNRPGEVAKK